MTRGDEIGDANASSFDEDVATDEIETGDPDGERDMVLGEAAESETDDDASDTSSSSSG